jgi:hypothetical protein
MKNMQIETFLAIAKIWTRGAIEMNKSHCNSHQSSRRQELIATNPRKELNVVTRQIFFAHDACTFFSGELKPSSKYLLSNHTGRNKSTVHVVCSEELLNLFRRVFPRNFGFFGRLWKTLEFIWDCFEQKYCSSNTVRKILFSITMNKSRQIFGRVFETCLDAFWNKSKKHRSVLNSSAYSSEGTSLSRWTRRAFSSKECFEFRTLFWINSFFPSDVLFRRVFRIVFRRRKVWTNFPDKILQYLPKWLKTVQNCIQKRLMKLI